MPTLTEDFEVYAVTLLLCTPSRLNELWTKKGTEFDQAAIDQYLDSLGLSANGRKHADEQMKKLDVARFIFKATAETLQEFAARYSGPLPHPSNSDAIAIVKALQGIV